MSVYLGTTKVQLKSAVVGNGPQPTPSPASYEDVCKEVDFCKQVFQQQGGKSTYAKKWSFAKASQLSKVEKSIMKELGLDCATQEQTTRTSLQALLMQLQYGLQTAHSTHMKMMEKVLLTIGTTAKTLSSKEFRLSISSIG